MIRGFDRLQKIVEMILFKLPVTRDSNNALFLAYLNYAFKLNEKISPQAYAIIKQAMMSKECPSVESLTRARRKIQSSGLYQGDRAKRKRMAANTAAYFRNHK